MKNRNVDPISDVDLNAKFKALHAPDQQGFLNPAAHVLWTGHTVTLCVVEDGRVIKDLARMSADGCLRKIKLWCVKNSYRCPQLRDDRIWL